MEQMKMYMEDVICKCQAKVLTPWSPTKLSSLLTILFKLKKCLIGLVDFAFFKMLSSADIFREMCSATQLMNHEPFESKPF